MGDEDSTFHPSLAATDTLTQIYIAANDGTRGEFELPEEFRVLSVNESALMIEIPIRRAFGAYGDVSVFIYSQTSSNAVLEQDYSFESHELYFASGVSVRMVNVSILEDSTPETDELFELVLASPKGGATLGQYKTCQITITENDGAGGVIQFVSNDTVTLQETFSADGYPTSVEFELSRGPGTFGAVDISYKVVDESGEETTQVQPSSGSVGFSDQQGSAIISLSVIDDDIPELSQRLTVSISAQYTSLLGALTEREIIIVQSDSPNGLLSIYTGANVSSIDIEEENSIVTCNVYRTGGLLGDISVSVITEPQTASARSGTDLYVSPVQKFDFLADNYCALGEYLLALNVIDSNNTASTTSRLYKLQGTYQYIADISVTNAVKCLSYYNYDQQYFIIFNQDSSELMSSLYVISKSDELSKLENIPTRGAVDAAVLNSGGSTYVVVLNSLNANNEPQSFSLQNYFTEQDRLVISSQMEIGSAAVSVETLTDMTVLAQSDSVKIYSISGPIWTLTQTLLVDNIIDIAVANQTNTVLLMIGTASGIRVYSHIGGLFVSVASLPLEGLVSLESFMFRYILGITVSSQSGSSILHWDSLTSNLTVKWFSNSSGEVTPLSVREGEVLLASVTDGVSSLNLLDLLDQPDYIPR